MKRSLLLAAVLLALAASEARASYLTVGGQHAQFLRPHRPTNRLVIYVHGAGGTAETITADAAHLSLTNALLGHGFAVAASDAHGMQNWGDPASVIDYVHLAHRLPSTRIYILAESMGALDGVQLIDRLHPKAWGGIYPVCNVASLKSEVLINQIYETWDGPAPARLSPVTASNVEGLPVLMWASPGDHFVPKAQNADTCARRMKKGGANVDEISTTGDHGDLSNFQPARLLHFFLSAQ
jgi:hypothetical protein